MGHRALFVAVWMLPALSALKTPCVRARFGRPGAPSLGWRSSVCACRSVRFESRTSLSRGPLRQGGATAPMSTFASTTAAAGGRRQAASGATSLLSEYISRKPVGPFAVGARGLSLSASAQVRPVALPLNDDEKRLFKLLLRVVEEEKMGTTLRVAGGWVRDKLLFGHERAGSDFASPKLDIDIALDNCLGREFAEKVNSFLLRNGHKSNGIGLVSKNPDKSKHLETATMLLGSFWVDFVNLRTESYTLDSRIPNMGIGTPEEDAFRRDLTINSLFYNINTGCVEDFTGRGASDLAAGLIATPLPAKTTLLDDPLRVLRSVRFASRFRFRLAEELVEACLQTEVHEALGKKVSRERIGAEIDLMVRSREPLRAFELICQLGLAPVIFPLPPSANVPALASSSSVNAAVAAAAAPARSSSVKAARASPSADPAAAVAFATDSSPAATESAISDGSSSSASRSSSATSSSSASSSASSSSTSASTSDAAAKTDLSELFVQSLVYLKNMHHLLRDGAVAAATGMTPNHASNAEQRRLALYAAFLLPFAASTYSEGRKHGLALVRFMVAEQLKRRTRDADTVHLLHSCALDFQLLLRRSAPGPLTEAANTRFVVDRMTAGLLVRRAGPNWGTALLLALTADLGVQHILDNEVRERTGREADEAIIAAYVHLALAIRALDLDGAWALPPPLNGNEVMTLLPNIGQGPHFKGVMDEQVRWMLRHPAGTTEDAKRHLLSLYGQYNGPSRGGASAAKGAAAAAAAAAAGGLKAAARGGSRGGEEEKRRVSRRESNDRRD